MKRVFLQDHTREEITEMAAEGFAIVIPLAATEQHGPHLPVGTDSLICRQIAFGAVEKASEKAALLMTQVLQVGCSNHHLAFGGTISLSSETYMRVLREIGESLVTSGFRKILFLNAHGGNAPLMHQTANDLAVQHPIWTASASYWSIAREALHAVNANEVGMVPGHAGGFETSVVMAIMPELVWVDRIRSTHESRSWIPSSVPETFIGRHMELTGFDGFTDAAGLATPEKGKLYLNAIIESVSEWLVRTMNAMEMGERTL
ncbi:creatininase family protein [Cohnella sp.]|uniref:creatininase family protein n=1 Tax=Cohnella sp. TaxID=1883426 RepID=UPI0035649688